MTLRFWGVACLVVAGLVSAALAQIPLPTANPQTQFSSGQSVVPVYEGWMKNPDGTFTFVFGYFNRNRKEEPVIPAGPNNKLEPGPADRGQPTFFLPRRQPWVFRVQVPADWGQKELVWSITVNGKTERAYAQMILEEEILERMIMARGNLNPGEDDPNKPPTVTIAPVTGATLANPVTLTATVTDDGLPKPRVPKTPSPDANGTAQVNNSGRLLPTGLNVTWYQYGGPAKVDFDSTGPIAVSNGRAPVTARFTAPGTYILRALASDGGLQKAAEITVTVK
ncbi:MAG: hypothetical protein EXQ47_07865 [Bryobacterales bacterium]|nr:hypothetical protein [Bryobacterales bacterium]